MMALPVPPAQVKQAVPSGAVTRYRRHLLLGLDCWAASTVGKAPLAARFSLFVAAMMNLIVDGRPAKPEGTSSQCPAGLPCRASLTACVQAQAAPLAPRRASSSPT